MEIVYERVCGLDIHKDMIAACMIKKGRREHMQFGTMTDELLRLSSWLTENECQMTAMESTGSYWKPIYNILEAENVPVIIGNAQHIKGVPGRKTDVKDAEWIADLLRHGLINPSFVPPREMRDLRELVRYRKSLVQERAREFNRIQKVLEGANIKLGSVISDIDGKTGCAIIDAVIHGETDPDKLASLAKGSLRRKQEILGRSLTGLINDHLRNILSLMRMHIRCLDELIETTDLQIYTCLTAENDVLERLMTIPGVGQQSAEVIVSEIGTDMSKFPTAHHLASWAGICPGNNESAGKRYSGRIRKANNNLKTALAQCAKVNALRRGTYLNAQYYRIAARRGPNRATIAVAHTILIIAYYIIRDGTEYRELGDNYFDELKKEAVVSRSINRLKALGYEVSLSVPETV
ncbi:MAG: IS110 family transposase [Clostridia bacterium]|nr:IS110 family transposase [Clostridia bacterium]